MVTNKRSKVTTFYPGCKWAFLFWSMIIIGDKLFAAPYKTKENIFVIPGL